MSTPALGLNRAAMFSAPLALALLAGLGGCAAQSSYNKEHVQKAQEKIGGLKSGIEWQMAEQQFKAGDLDKALKTVDTSISLNDRVANSHVLRARILMEKGDLEQARASLLKAESIDEKSVDAQYYLGVLHERISQPDKALVRYQKAMTLEPQNAQYAVAAAETLVDLNRVREAEALLATQGESLSNSSAIRHAQARISMFKRDYPAAIVQLEQARLLAPDENAILEDLLQAQMAAGQFPAAESTAAQLLKQDANAQRADLVLAQARCLAKMERYTEARTALLRLTDADKADADTWRFLGEVCAKMGDFNRLRSIGSRLVSMDHQRYEGYLFRAMHFRWAGDLNSALEQSSQAASNAQGSAVPLLYRAMLLQQAGRIDEARSTTQQAAQFKDAGQAAHQLMDVLGANASATKVVSHPDASR